MRGPCRAARRIGAAPAPKRHCVSPTLLRLLWVVLVPVVACAPVHYVRINDPVGPLPPSRFASPAQDRGYLVVYSDTESVERGGDYYYPHTSYTIYTADGQRVRWVANSTDVEDESPDRVALSAGTYLIRARGLGRYLEVVVRIEPGYTTAVHLDGSWTSPSGAGAEGAIAAVDGTPIGWLGAPP